MSRKLKLILGLILPISLLIISILIILIIIFRYYKSKLTIQSNQEDMEHDKNRTDHHKQGSYIEEEKDGVEKTEQEELVRFQGGEDLTVSEILDAPGEVIWKSSYGTLYKAFLQGSNCVRLLRFLRPTSTSRVVDVSGVVRFLGCIRHPNLIPLLGFYTGPRHEMLLVYPFSRCGNLADFIRDGNSEYWKWTIIHQISIGIVKGMDHLHTGLQKPLVHGNLKSKNILLDRSHRPYISDFGLHCLLNPVAQQEMLEVSAAEGYKAPELIKMKDASIESDIYSLGIMLLELITGREPIIENPILGEDIHLPTFVRNSLLYRTITRACRPDLLDTSNENVAPITEQCLLRFLQLAMSCCSPSPSLRPTTKEILRKLQVFGR